MIAGSVIICLENNEIIDGTVQNPIVKKEVVCFEMDCLLGVPDRQTKHFPTLLL